MNAGNNTRDLVRRLKDGDEASVTYLVERYGPRLLSAAQLLCGNATDAQDLMIETLQKAVRAIGSFRETASLFSWLYGILFNLNRMAWRKRTHSRLTYTDDLPEVAEETDPVGHTLDETTVADALACAIRQLSDIHQEVILLRYYGEMSIPEIAATLAINPGTVKSRLFNATAQLKMFLPPEIRAAWTGS